MNLAKLKEIDWKGDIVKQLNSVFNNRIRLDKQIEMEYDGMLRIKVYEQGLKERYIIFFKKTIGGGGNKKLYRIQIGAFSRKDNAENLAFRAKARGFNDALVKQEGRYYKAQIGAFSVRENADNTLKKPKEKGFNDAFIV